MNIQYHKHFSSRLNRDMEYKTYEPETMAEDCRSLLAFPSQDGRFYDYENFGMVEILRPWIDAGKLRVICCDGIDRETVSDFGGDARYRLELHEKWVAYICEELLPAVSRREGETFITTGCSMGAYHAGNFFFRRPDIFDTVIALSGLYHSHYSYANYNDDLTYANSPQDFIAGMPEDHPWIEMYRKRRIIICVGQGRWEDELLESTRQLDTVLCQKHVPAWFDYWGFDCDHDWCWWRRQLPYFMGNVIPL